MIGGIIAFLQNYAEQKRMEKIESNEKISKGPSWRHRRRLIYGAYFTAIGMIVFGAATFLSQAQVGVEMVIGGVALLSIIVTAYTTMATYEDTKIWQPEVDNNPDGTVE